MDQDATIPNPFLPTEAHPGPLILDGGLATALEARGFDLDDPLWSARVLVEAPDAVRQVHRDFLEAGADVIATVSYQATLPGFLRRGLEREEGLEVLRRAAELAVEARDAFWAVEANRTGRRRPLVAASVGPYGAYLADGSEYTGAYPVTEDELYDFHRERWHVFAGGPADLLACETIPSLPEVRVLLRLLGETPGRGAWLSLSCRDAAHLADATPLIHVARLCDAAPNLMALGVNCIEPEIVESLLEELRRGTAKPLVAYPNAGERYDVASRRWVTPPSPVDWAREARRWVEAGAGGVGGCCRVGPDRIRRMREVLTAV
ncbi:MAG TPA: homocysteine S-methyltransferase [Longimicrobiales bacterium]|nr:homocysteine S-methyltransferase [Longimicrobiales bacterium]